MLLAYLFTCASMILYGIVCLKNPSEFPDTSRGVVYKFAKKDRLSWNVANINAGMQFIYHAIIGLFLYVVLRYYSASYEVILLAYIGYLMYSFVAIYFIVKKKTHHVINDINKKKK